MEDTQLKTLFLYITLSFLSISFVYAESKSEPLTMGIFPYASTSKLVSHHKNIKKHINKDGAFSISLVTATDVATYTNNVINFKYDLVYSAPHLARYIEKHYGYQRVTMTSNKIQGVFLTQIGSNIKSISDLENKQISMAPAKTILHQATLLKLENNNLIAGKNIRIKTVKTHNNAIFDVINKDSDAAITGINLWNKLKPRHKKHLKQFDVTEPTTGFIILSKPSIKKSTIEKLQKLFLSFNNTLAGKAYIFKGFQPISDKAMESLDFHSKVFERK